MNSLLRRAKQIPLFNDLTAPLRTARLNQKIQNGTLLAGLSDADRQTWLRRTEQVLASPDFPKIEKQPGAGRMRGRYFVMHNGLRIEPLSYYGYPVLDMLLKTGGIHEPEEELEFGRVLPTIPAGGTMLELGSFWAFYSMWFHQVVPQARNFMIEPERAGLTNGKLNFRANGFRGNFTNAFVGKTSASGQPPTVSVDDFVQKKGIQFLDMLHSDIQGYELDMLAGARRLFDEKRVGYVFISTHGDDLHEGCLNFLTERNFEILRSVPLAESHSFDGLIAAKAPYYLPKP